MSKRKKGSKPPHDPDERNVAGGMYVTTPDGPALRLNFKYGSTKTHNKSVRRRLAKGVKVQGK